MVNRPELNGLEIRNVELRKVCVRFKTNTFAFRADISEAGYDFYVNENSAGNTNVKAVHLSPDDIWNIIKDKGVPPLSERRAKLRF